MAILENRIAATRDLGGDAVVVHPAPVADRGRLNTFDVLDQVAESCLARGVRLALEADTEADAEPYFQRYPPEILGYCFDSGHCHVQTPPTPHPGNRSIASLPLSRDSSTLRLRAALFC